MSLMEVCAVGLAVAYVLLAIYQRRLCWIAAIASAALYIVIFWQVQLYLEAALQVFYIAMAIYGWFAWSRTLIPSKAFVPGRSDTISWHAYCFSSSASRQGP